MNLPPDETLPRVFPTVVDMLADACARFPQQTALRCGERQLSYREYRNCVAGFADELIGYGARRSRVALVCANSLDLPIAMFAVHAAGAQAVPINPAYTERELGYILSDADPVAIVYDADIAGKVDALIQATGIPYTVRIGGDGGRQLDVWRDHNNLQMPQSPNPDAFRDITIYWGYDRLAERRQHQPPADVDQYQPARSSTADTEGRRKHSLHDAALPRLCGRDVSASFGAIAPASW